MDIKEKSIIYEKRIECGLGILFLVPPFLGVFFFLLSLCDVGGDFVNMTDLSGQWDWHSGDYGASMSPAPLYLGLMAIAGAFLIPQIRNHSIKPPSCLNQVNLPFQSEGIRYGS